MLVYVINKHGKPLMPCSPRKARILLRDGKAKVVERTPFTIQLLFGSSGYTQPVTLGVDAGSKVVGISATTEKKELYAAETTLRNDIVGLLSTRRSLRRNRRNRLRYRKARFLNRVKTKKKGWLAPSIQHKIDSHLKLVAKVYEILPITKIIAEVASFDIQKIKNPDISGVEYQQGEQLGFYNVRAYVMHRDGHKCRGKEGCKEKILNVHHIESRAVGGDAPNNLITLCEKCHRAYHDGKLKLNLKRGKSYKDATFMGIMRWAFYGRLKELYDNVSLTFGYLTKNTRITNGLPKEHLTDAYCISGNLKAEMIKTVYRQKFVRKSNRQLHKENILKGGVKKVNKAPYIVKGFRLFDKVIYDNMECFIFARRISGYFNLRKLDGTTVHASAKSSMLKLLNISKTLLIERWERTFFPA